MSARAATSAHAAASHGVPDYRARRLLSSVSDSGVLPLVLLIGIPVLFALALLLTVLRLLCCRRKRVVPAQEPAPGESKGAKATTPARPSSSGSSSSTSGWGLEASGSSGNSAKQFAQEDILRFTENWAEERLISDGSHSSVYLGRGEDGRPMAVKRTLRPLTGVSQTLLDEVALLQETKHPKLVRFLGFCPAANEDILVFEHMPNGSLASWLRPTSGDEDRPALNFPARLRVALDVALALKFLHSINRIHRSVSSRAVLLDDSFGARLGGLGLAKHKPGRAQRLRAQALRGYRDPEEEGGARPARKMDVYALGVVMLELVTGRGPVLEVPGEAGGDSTELLATWALSAITNNSVRAIVDPRMHNVVNDDILELIGRFSQVAEKCVAPLRSDRPPIEDVLDELQELKRQCKT